MKGSIIRCVLSIAFLLFILLPFGSFDEAQTQDNIVMPIDFKIVDENLDIYQIAKHIEFLSSLPTRSTGYPGCAEAADYIEKTLGEIGLKVERDKYAVLVPVDQGTNVTLLPQGITLEAYALWPNDIQTCPIPYEGMEGRIQYVGKGKLEDFDGLNLTDSIVLMDFNSNDNWLDAAKFGAKAVIFIEPEETIRTEAEQKFILTPLYFPRIYLPRNAGLNLKEMTQTGEVTHVRIKSRMVWQQRTAENLIAVIPGREFPNEIIVVGAYYDSWSVAPKLSPGAEEAISPATLLELARILQKIPPKRTVWLVFYSGHWQALAGARNFVEDYYFQNQTYAAGEKRLLLNIGLKLSSSSDTLSLIMSGDLYAQILESRPYGTDDVYRFIMRDWIPVLNTELSYNFSYHFQDWQTLTVTKSELLDSEPSSIAGISSFTFLTTTALKIYVGTPFDTSDKVSWTNLKPQILFVSCAITSLAHQDFQNTNILRYYQLPQRRIWRGTGSTVGPGQAGFDRLAGTVERYNLSIGFYERVPGAILEVIRVGGSRSFNPFARMLTLANDKGEYEIAGLVTDLLAGFYDIYGYVINQTDGSIVYAPDLGIYGAGGGTYAGYSFLNVRIDRDPMFVKTIVFQCKSVVLFDVINSLLMRQSRPALHFYSTDVERPPSSLVINDFISHSTPTSYGMVTPYDTGNNIATLFVSPETVYEVILTTTTPEKPTQPIPMGLLTNASETKPEGSGYSSDVGVIRFTGLRFLEDLIHIDSKRARLLVEYKMLTPSAREYYNLARTYLEKANRELENMHYSKAYDYLTAAWNFEANAYLEVRGSVQDLINASIVFYFMAIPFTIIFERLIFPTSGLKRFFEIVGLVALLTAITFMLHPGFALISNIVGSMLGLAVLVISVPVIVIIFSNVSKYAKEIRGKVLGAHFAEISRSEAFMIAVSTGISNLRRRLLRTVLNLVTVSIIVFSLVSFTSSSSFTIIKGYPAGSQAPYPGMMLRQNFGMIPFSPQILSLLSTSFGDEATICPRSWVYPPPSGEETIYYGSWTAGLGSIGLQSATQTSFVYSQNGTRARLRALLGLIPEENEITNVSLALTQGSRWFVEGEMYSCILNNKLQSELNVNIGDTIKVMGVTLRIVGIADTELLKGVYDLSGEDIAPINPQKAPVSPAQKFVPLSWDYVIIVPFDLAYNVFNGRVNDIAVKTGNLSKLNDVLNELVMGTYQSLEIFVSTKDGNVMVYRRGREFMFQGSDITIVPMLMGGLTILVTLLGSIIERRMEIAVYSSVGLSPLHVAGMFLAESLTYAILGSLFGYLFGLLGIRLLLLFKFVPEGMTVNFTSSFVLIAILFSMLMVILSSIYPSRKASLMVTPSLKRRWEIRTKPVGDDWVIPMPFTSTEEEVDGVLRFLSEFLEVYTSRDAGTFLVRSKEIRENLTAETPCKELVAETSLAPWDSGLIQEVFIRATKQKGGRNFDIHLKYVIGDKNVWVKRNPKLVDILRKQLLLLRGLKEEEKRRYI